MKKLISGIAIGALLVSGILFTQLEDLAHVGEREPSIYSVEQPSYSI
ncbi:hypothetical protein QGM71_12640 [Virgibacillus sp. C22-A2]|uniref:Phr family secreted Rap phosphatase inhibitor n=1 Tax=Virgibacillus tibetensis TaxID=3042313 RepID=A0ABU6KGP1_9BACI|nr:hypothetical protein [Virgibacillus sp. C22-A2]